MSQNPSSGVNMTTKSRVSLVMSKGPALITVPSVIGKNESIATQEIINSGLTIGTITTQSSSTTSGYVIRQSLTAGNHVSTESVVNLVVSNGSDGVDDTIEQQAPNNGDGNHDGIADSTQANVVSIKALANTTQRTTLNPYITVDASDSACTKVSHVNVSTEAAFGSDPSFDHEAGLVNFTLNCSEANITIYYYGLTQAPTAIRKYGLTPKSPQTKVWYDMTGTITSDTIHNRIVYKASYTLKDGALGDDDLTINGTIIDPIGLGIEKQALIANTASKPIPTLSFWGLLTLSGLMHLLTHKSKLRQKVKP